MAYDSATGGLDPFLNGIAAEGVDFSPDLSFAAYTSYPEGELWRSRLRDGSDRRRLTEGPLRAALPRWSPDGRTIAFTGRPPDGSWQIHLVSAEDGEVEVLPLANASDPGWTSDGRAIVFGIVSDRPAALYRFDLATRRQTMVSGSDGLFSPRPSPDGRWLAALRRSSEELVLFDSQTGQWSSLTDHAVSYPAWTREGDWLHFRHAGEGTAFYRLDPLTRRVESVARVEERALAGGEWGAWSGLTPEGAPLMLVERQDDRLAVGDWWPVRSRPALARGPKD
jgi:Tol biopolymer transport system component